MKKLLFLLSVMLSSITAMAQVGFVFTSKDSEGNKLSYKIMSDNEVMLCRSKQTRIKESTINVPETVDFKKKKYTVCDIEDAYFFYYRNVHIEKIVLPNTITELRSEFYLSDGDKHVNGVFEYNKYLKEVVLPNRLKKIGPLAFKECEALEEVIFPQSVMEIGGGCFAQCKKLKHVKLPPNIKELGTYEGIFTWSVSRDHYYEPFFYYCESLEEIELPSTIVNLGAGCFNGCKSLKSIKIPDNVEKLESYDDIGCFNYCSNLEKIVLSKNLKEIEIDCFKGCDKLKKIIGLHHGISVKTSYYEREFYNKFLDSFESYKADAVHEVYKWQQKRDFETAAEYKARVTPENRQKKVQEYLAKAIKEYTDKNKIQVTLGQYDTDAEVFTLNSNYGTKYVKVPRSAAPDFKEGFANAAFEPSYVMGNDFPKVADMIIFVNGKSYTTEKSAVEQSNYDLAIDLPDIDLGIGKDGNQNSASKPLVVDRTIDESIPNTTQNNTITFAVIIGNERYTRVAQVPYANNDARIFAEYCKKTLGLPDKNVKVYENATYGTMIGAVSDIQKIAKAFKGDANIIFYYAGHGIPDEATGDGYLLPIDADGLNMRVCYPLSQLYKELGEMQARSVTCFLDACFSGSQRGDGMVVAARGVAIKAKSDRPTGHTIVFTAATDKQTAYPYKEKGHGMFTYYLLKKLRDTKGDCTLGELGSYICDEVAKQAVVTNGKEQTPVVLTSDGVLDNWKNMKLK